MGIRSAIARGWRCFLWRFRDPEFDGLDLSDVSMRNGIISREAAPSRKRNKPSPYGHRKGEASLQAVNDCESLLIRIPLRFIDANDIAIRAGDELKVSRLSARSISIEMR